MNSTGPLVGNAPQNARFAMHLEEARGADRAKLAADYAAFQISAAEPNYLTTPQELLIDSEFVRKLGLHKKVRGVSTEDDDDGRDEPEDRERRPVRPPRRTHQPVRAQTKYRGEESAHWKPQKRKLLERILKAAQAFEARLKEWGRKVGPLGRPALLVLKALIDRVDWKTGQLDPSLDSLMKWTGCCRDTVVRALKALREHGFIDWIRRCEDTDIEGKGPQRRQITNAYWLMLPPEAEALLPKTAGPLKPDDALHHAEERNSQRSAMEHGMSKRDHARMNSRGSSVDRAIETLGSFFDQRESAHRTESGSLVY